MARPMTADEISAFLAKRPNLVFLDVDPARAKLGPRSQNRAFRMDVRQSRWSAERVVSFQIKAERTQCIARKKEQLDALHGTDRTAAIRALHKGIRLKRAQETADEQQRAKRARQQAIELRPRPQSQAALEEMRGLAHLAGLANLGRLGLRYDCLDHRGRWRGWSVAVPPARLDLHLGGRPEKKCGVVWTSVSVSKRFP